MQDADGDSQMNSSPSTTTTTSSRSSSMFPSANSPTPPVASSSANLLSLHTQVHAPAEELSPPNSQDASIANDTMDLEPSSMVGNGEMSAAVRRRVDVAAGGEQMLRGSVEYPVEEDLRQPGWEWKNEKAREEAARSLEQVVDRGFSLEEFGDPFDERQSNGT